MASASYSGASGRDGLRQRQKPNAPRVDNGVESDSGTQPIEKTKLSSDGSLFNDVGQLERIFGPILLTGAALFTRLYDISKSHNVTWDEAHFGKFGSHYLKREYYFDVHPPLGKMLVGLSGYLAGYNGSFPFESGSEYPDWVNYSGMRVFNAMFNVFLVPLAYFTVKELGFSTPAVWLVSLMVLLETSYVTLGRLILLDSMLCFFTVSTFYCWAKFHNQQRRPFSRQWWTWITLTGLSIGCVCSVKMVGLFVTAVVGVYTVADLWIKFGDTTMPIKTYILHWVSRIWALIIIPLLVFMAAFKVHFIILSNSGPGDSNMSSLFQANLVGNNIEGGPVDVAFGSVVTLKNQGLNGGLLHSHVQLYPEGSEQQQVTTYHHKDNNNDWFIEHKRFDPAYNEEDELQFLQDGDIIRLSHTQTGRNLHTHEVKAPVTKSKWEVSCYGNATVGDEKDNWVVEIMENLGDENKSLIHPLSTSFRLRNQVLGCYLSAEGNNLPQWGFRQGEVTCDRRPSKREKKTWWNVENHWNTRLPDAEDRVLPKTSFLRDFIQLNFAMMATNNALVPDPDKQDDLASLAWEWPVVHVGLRLCGWGVDNVRIFLMGHPTTTWLSTLGVFAFGITTVVYILRWQRQYNDFNVRQLEQYAVAGLMPLIGWFFHYVPFIAMARVTYVHHYLPALYFAILTFVFLVDFATQKWANRALRAIIYMSLYAVTVGIFVYFMPIAYGMTGELDQYSHLKWFSTWRIV